MGKVKDYMTEQEQQEAIGKIIEDLENEQYNATYNAGLEEGKMKGFYKGLFVMWLSMVTFNLMDMFNLWF